MLVVWVDNIIFFTSFHACGLHCFHMMCLWSRKGQKHCKTVFSIKTLHEGPQQCLLFLKSQIERQSQGSVFEEKHLFCLWENAGEFLLKYSFHSIFTVSAYLSIFLTESTTIPNINEVKENMTMGTTLVVNPDGSGFLVGNILRMCLHWDLYMSSVTSATVN